MKRIAEMGFEYADITDNHPGNSLGRDAGFTAQVSLDDNPYDIKRTFEKFGLKTSTFCAHASLLDPSSPSRYGTSEIIQAIKVASIIHIPYVVTTEGEPHSEWAEKLSFEQKVLVISEKLYEPIRLATDLGVTILLKPHGPLTDTIEGMKAIIECLGNPTNPGVNLDTGNSWLGGSDPVEFAKAFKEKIHHVHWKDLPEERSEKNKEVNCTSLSYCPLLPVHASSKFSLIYDEKYLPSPEWTVRVPGRSDRRSAPS